MKKMLLIGLATLGCVLAAVPASPAATWKTFTSKEGRFSVLLPGKPLEQTKTWPSPMGKLPMHMSVASVPGSGAIYGVAYLDLPLGTADPEDVLDGAVAGLVQGAKGEVLSKEKIELGTYPGREVKAEVFGGEGVIQARAYAVGDRLYLLLAVVSKDDADSPDLERFLDSFQVSTDEDPDPLSPSQ